MDKLLILKLLNLWLANNEYSVDGISGSTITSKGVEILLKKDAGNMLNTFLIN